MNAITMNRHDVTRAQTIGLTEDLMRRFAPSIFQTEAHHSRSERFVPIATIEVVRGLVREGWVPTWAGQSKTRIADKRDFTKHMLRFRRPDAKALDLDGTFVELVLRNGNDGSSAYKLDAGLFRLVCLNGMVAKSADYGNISVRHTGEAVQKVIEGSFQVLDSATKVVESQDVFKQITLSRDEQRVFGEAAHHIRFERDEAGNTTSNITVEQLLAPRRAQDRKDDLWTTFNRVQENVIKGGLIGRPVNRNERRTSMREVRGIDQNVKLNQALWLLTERMAELKAA